MSTENLPDQQAEPAIPEPHDPLLDLPPGVEVRAHDSSLRDVRAQEECERDRRIRLSATSRFAPANEVLHANSEAAAFIAGLHEAESLDPHAVPPALAAACRWVSTNREEEERWRRVRSTADVTFAALMHGHAEANAFRYGVLSMKSQPGVKSVIRRVAEEMSQSQNNPEQKAAEQSSKEAEEDATTPTNKKMSDMRRGKVFRPFTDFMRKGKSKADGVGRQDSGSDIDTLELGSTQKRNKGETTEAFLRRVTHLSVVGKGVEVMENLNRCRNLTVLYLYDNHITTISNLESCRFLTRLYLQNNAITEISGLDCGLDRLTVLHLGGNRIQKVTNLHALPALEQLHLNNQKLDPGTSLDIDADSMEALGLEYLDLANTGIRDFQPLKLILATSQFLATLDVSQNPVTSDPKLRQKLILAGPALSLLNDKKILPTERAFIQNMAQAKAEIKSRRSSGVSDLGGAGKGSGGEDKTPAAGLGLGNEGTADARDQVLPHLPPYASQYR
ncbi:hypothetical protein HK104_011386 [Borealophlyctis nickersoniae]|nr:hypothetical protein HK104_011386 [Borealophlyctis nickersoniae]